jgi:hypothetical protein
MPLEHEMAELLTGHHFFLHSDHPGLGILRLDAKGDQRWWLVTREDLLALSIACAKYAEELQVTATAASPPAPAPGSR